MQEYEQVLIPMVYELQHHFLGGGNLSLQYSLEEKIFRQIRNQQHIF